MTRVAFRADAGPSIGSGHIRRCRALADALKRRGSDSCFYVRDCPTHIRRELLAAGHPVWELRDKVGGDLDEVGDAIEFLDVCDARDCIAVVDHYQLGAVWEDEVRSAGLPILAIDDLSSRQHHCDWFLDQNYRESSGYRLQSRVGASTVSLLGPRYALLREEFEGAHRRAVARSESIANVLVCLGGSDYRGLTYPLAHAARSVLGPETRVCAVFGSPRPTSDEVPVDGLSVGIDTFECPVNFVECLLNADFAVGAAGSMNWERCCVGLPAVVFPVAENQMEGLFDLSATGAVAIGDLAKPIDSVSEVLRTIASDGCMLRQMSEAALSLCDGRGASRVADMLIAKGS